MAHVFISLVQNFSACNESQYLKLCKLQTTGRGYASQRNVACWM
jgi:hypothetical protein